MSDLCERCDGDKVFLSTNTMLRTIEVECNCVPFRDRIKELEEQLKEAEYELTMHLESEGLIEEHKS